MIEMCNINYCQALELDPHSGAARISMAYLLQSEGRFMDAWNTLTEGSARDQGEMNCRTIEFRVCFSCCDSCSWLGAKLIQNVTTTHCPKYTYHNPCLVYICSATLLIQTPIGQTKVSILVQNVSLLVISGVSLEKDFTV